MSDGWFYLSTLRMTGAVHVSDGLVRDTPPIMRRFIGQRPEALGGWLRKQGGFTAARLPDQPVSEAAGNLQEGGGGSDG